MPHTARQFEPQITRHGGIPAKYRFTARCSSCATTTTYEASQAVGDDVVKAFFKDKGWLLGRERSHDLCPACVSGNRPGRSPGATVGQPAPSAQKHPDRTAEILARHLGKPEALAAEVFRPREVQPPRAASAHDAPRQPGSAPALSPEVEQALTGMAADLKSLRSTLELMAEQVGQLVALGTQQVEAIAYLAPLMIRSTQELTQGLQQVVTAVQERPAPAQAVPSQQLVSSSEITTNLGPQADPDQQAHPDPAPLVEAVEAPEAVSPRPRKVRQAQRTVPAQTLIKSIPDAKREDRFYTTIRLPRELWDQAGLSPTDRIQIGSKGKSLIITRVTEGGIKPKSVGDAVVVLQSWRLGDLTCERVKATPGEGSIRLKMAL